MNYLYVCNFYICKNAFVVSLLWKKIMGFHVKLDKYRKIGGLWVSMVISITLSATVFSDPGEGGVRGKGSQLQLSPPQHSRQTLVFKSSWSGQSIKQIYSLSKTLRNRSNLSGHTLQFIVTKLHPTPSLKRQTQNIKTAFLYLTAIT